MHVPGGENILLGRRGHPAGMVVSQNQAGGICPDGQSGNLPQIDLGSVDTALMHQLYRQTFAFGVQQEDIDQFLMTAHKPRQQKLLRVLVAADVGPLLPVGIIDPCDTGDQLEEGCGILTDPFDLQQPLIGGFAHAAQAAEPVNEPMGQLVGVLPGNAVKQQQFQDLMGFKALKPFCQKPRRQAFSVSVMDAHPALPFLSTEVCMKRIFLCLFLLLTLMGLPALAGDQPMRGVWVSTVYHLDYPSKAGLTAQALADEADVIIENAKKWGLNAVFLQVRPAGDALYASSTQPWSALLSGKQGQAPADGFDPLAYFVEQCHQNGLELHAWLNPYRLTRTAAATREEALAQLCDSHPARLLADCLVFHTDGCLYLDPGRPEVRQHLLAVTEEILQNYDVDGIHLDDYFYPGPDFADEKTVAAFGGDFVWASDFRREAVNQLVSALHEQAARYGKVFGVSPTGIWATADRQPMGAATTGSQSYYDHFADSRKWVREGMVDYIAPQIYWEMGAAAGDFSVLLDWWSDTVVDTDVDLYIGLAAYKSKEAQPGSVWYGESELQRQLEAINACENADGAIFFRYGSLLNSAIAQTLASAEPEPMPVRGGTRRPTGLTVEGAGTNQSVLSGQALAVECSAPRGSTVKVLYGTGWQSLKSDLDGGYQGRMAAETPYQGESYTAPALYCAEKHGILFVQLSPFTVTSVEADETVSVEDISWSDTENGHEIVFHTKTPAAADLCYMGDVVTLTFSPCRLGVLFHDDTFDHMEAVQKDLRTAYRLVFPDDGQTRQLALLWEPDKITLTIKKNQPEQPVPAP